MTESFFRSSVRPLVTYAFSLALIVAVFTGHVPGEALRDVAIAVIMFWFGQRSAEKREGDQR